MVVAKWGLGSGLVVAKGGLVVAKWGLVVPRRGALAGDAAGTSALAGAQRTKAHPQLARGGQAKAAPRFGRLAAELLIAPEARCMV